MTWRRAALLSFPSLALVATWALFHVRPLTGLMWGLGLMLGIALHRSRFCLAAAFQDAILFHDTAPAKAVIVALALSLVGFGWLQYHAMRIGAPLPGNIYAISPATLVGALLFGMGTVPGGGCTITTVLRLGEGHLRFLWTLLGLAAGVIVGALQYPWWMGLGRGLPPVHLPSILGWGGAVLLEAALTGCVWLLLSWWERKGVHGP